MSDAVRFPLVLGVISLCSAAGLAVSYSVTRDEIRLQEKLRKARGLSEVLGVELDEEQLRKGNVPWKQFTCEGRRGDPDPSFAVYELTDPERGPLYAAEGKAQGYSSKVEVVVAVDQGIEGGMGEARILAIKVVKQLETPGLGSKCTEPEFQGQFQDLPWDLLRLIKAAPYRKPDDAESAKQSVAAITGATITSNAVIAAVKLALDRIAYHIEQRKAAAG